MFVTSPVFGFLSAGGLCVLGVHCNIHWCVDINSSFYFIDCDYFVNIGDCLVDIVMCTEKSAACWDTAIHVSCDDDDDDDDDGLHCHVITICYFTLIF